MPRISISRGGGGGGGAEGGTPSYKPYTVEPRFNDLRQNDIPDITINIFQPDQCLIQ